MAVGETKVYQILLHLEHKWYWAIAGKPFRNFCPKFFICETQIETILPQNQGTVVDESGFKILVIFLMEQV